MTKATVIHKSLTAGRLDVVYVGRPSKWGNPFVIGVDGTRKEVIERYRAYLIGTPALLAAAKSELKGKTLSCWCKPKPCHGDVLLSVANSTTVFS